MSNQKHLLPIGFYDLIGNEAAINQSTIDLLLETFYQSHYQLIKTPLVEFEQSLPRNQEKWNKLDEQSFKMVDNFSGKTLVLRSDITPQIARLLATRLQNAQLPIRLCYVGDVLKMKNDNLYADRQLTQVGLELIGENDQQNCFSANLEVVRLAIAGLEKIKLSNLLINFCCPQFLDSLLEDLRLENIINLKEAIVSKNISAIKNLAEKYSQQLIALTLESESFIVINQAVASLPISQNNQDKLRNWQNMINHIKQQYPHIKFSIDIFGDEEFFYHQNIGFTVFANHFPYPIARGGRYIVNQTVPAVGFTIYINNLRKILT